MEDLKLTEEQTEKLFDFCRKHYINFYDIQIELVDHISSDIEKMWKKNPNLSFEDALDESYKRYGVMGFSKIKLAKQKELRNKYDKLFWKYTGSFLTTSKFIITLLITVLFATLFHFINDNRLVFMAYFFLLVIFIFIYLYYLYPKYYRIPVVKGKTFLLTDYTKDKSLMLCILPGLFMLMIHFNYLSYRITYHWWNEIIFALILAAFTIITYVFFFNMPKKMRSLFIDKYPQFIES